MIFIECIRKMAHSYLHGGKAPILMKMEGTIYLLSRGLMMKELYRYYPIHAKLFTGRY